MKEEIPNGNCVKNGDKNNLKFRFWSSGGLPILQDAINPSMGASLQPSGLAETRKRGSPPLPEDER